MKFERRKGNVAIVVPSAEAHLWPKFMEDGCYVHHVTSDEAIVLRDQLDELLPASDVQSMYWMYQNIDTNQKLIDAKSELTALKAENDRLRLMVAQHGVSVPTGGADVLQSLSQWITITEPPASITKPSGYTGTRSIATALPTYADLEPQSASNAAMIERDGPPDRIPRRIARDKQPDHDQLARSLRGPLEEDAALVRGLAANVKRMGGF